MDVILTGRNTWMLLEDYKRLKQEYRSMQFSKSRGRNGRAARKWEKFVKAFCRIEFHDELELLNLYKTALHPLGKKKVAVFRSKKWKLIIDNYNLNDDQSTVWKINHVKNHDSTIFIPFPLIDVVHWFLARTVGWSDTNREDQEKAAMDMLFLHATDKRRDGLLPDNIPLSNPSPYLYRRMAPNRPGTPSNYVIWIDGEKNAKSDFFATLTPRDSWKENHAHVMRYRQSRFSLSFSLWTIKFLFVAQTVLLWKRKIWNARAMGVTRRSGTYKHSKSPQSTWERSVVLGAFQSRQHPWSSAASSNFICVMKWNSDPHGNFR